MDRFDRVVDVFEFEQDIVKLLKKHKLKNVCYRYDTQTYFGLKGHTITLVVERE